MCLDLLIILLKQWYLVIIGIIALGKNCVTNRKKLQTVVLSTMHLIENNADITEILTFSDDPYC